MTSEATRYRIESLAKGLTVLRLFDERTQALKLREICDRTGIPMPTAFRIVATLEEEGFIERMPDGSVRPGVAVLTLGSAALRGSGLVQASELTLRELADATGETVNLGVLRGDEVLYLVRLRNSDLVTANVQVGTTLPAVHTSMGKVLLSGLGRAELGRLLDGVDLSEGGGPNALRSRESLEQQLLKIRRLGYAVQDQELAAGLRSVSVPVVDASGAVVAAINIAVASTRHSVADLEKVLLPQVQQAAAQISRRIQTQ
ncbi:IclR family transcriptional regulator [Salinibacterium sp. SYSU T00001]|uniref:IclR family transcriptional regulator n=1 Tax=Homoserinimonas sedimenticola TaxID=2986805 RepID=UPI0022357349|nr:IclR family transcriptional regulator [Salinibacterium sedimenticola]MCW4386239.1 IclR family transcriptional regulator [Salinibacterium sedimenticola]